MRIHPLLSLPLVLVLAGCAATAWSGGAPLDVPSYAADDPRPRTGGFVRDVQLAETERDGDRFILMAFEVGTTLTLGAMVEGDFEGDVVWRLNDAKLTLRLASKQPPAGVSVTVEEGPSGVEVPVGQQAGFRGYRWVNIELDSARWLPGRIGALSLTFEPEQGDAVRLPVDEHVFAARLVEAP